MQGNLSLRLTREMDFPPPHFQASWTHHLRNGRGESMGSCSGWGERPGTESRAGTVRNSLCWTTPPQVQGYARGDWSRCSADGNHGYRTQASSTPHQTDLTCTYMQAGICTHAYTHTCVCTCTHIHACVCMHTQANLYSCMHTQTHTHTREHVQTHTYTCMCVYMHICVHMCAYIMNIHVHMCTSKHVLMHVHTYAHTHNMHRCVVHSYKLKCMLMHACIIHTHKHMCALLHTHTLMPSRKELLYSFPSSSTVDLSPHCVTPDAQHLF